MEMSFAGEEEVIKETEQLITAVWNHVIGRRLPKVFPRMTYHEAMASYGSDKPDLRFKTKVLRPIQLVSDVGTDQGRFTTLPNT